MPTVDWPAVVGRPDLRMVNLALPAEPDTLHARPAAVPNSFVKLPSK